MKPVELYLRVRDVEGRLYPDEEAVLLPKMRAGHPLEREWRLRAESCSRLTSYLSRLPPPLAILDLGCGNGWLSNRLSGVPAAQVRGIDWNIPELHQAKSLFGTERLHFIAADALKIPFPNGVFDVIVLASVIQYFPDLADLIRSLKPLLRPGGEIHILDSPMYKIEELPRARESTNTYYESLGYPEMAEHYFHHPLTALDEFSPYWLYLPNSLRSRLQRVSGRDLPPFPWVRLR